MSKMIEDEEACAALATCIPEPQVGIAGIQTIELRWTYLAIWLQFWHLGKKLFLHICVKITNFLKKGAKNMSMHILNLIILPV